MMSAILIPMIKNQRGQAIVESSLVGLFAATIIITFLMACYLTFSSYWIKHNLYESLICYETTHKISSCEDFAKARIQKVLSLTRQEGVKILTHSQNAMASLQLQLHVPLLESKRQKISFEENLRF